jgi:Fe-S-cluster-containing hydrogenase component 2
MAKVLAIDPEKCTSCRLCELACAQRNGGAYRPSRSRIRVAIQVDEAFYFPMVCFQCADAPCVKECPSEALERDPATMVVRLIADRCNECAVCESACPYGVIRCVDGKAIKCEMCDGDPECVRFCAPGALRFETEDQWPMAERLAYAEQLEQLVTEAET